VISRKEIAMLQVGYYRLSKENRTLILSKIRELANLKQIPPDQKQKNVKTRLSEADGSD
jgi:mRNA-degrading endonuclease RelE of RelBE toxin-antitoxin system